MNRLLKFTRVSQFATRGFHNSLRPLAASKFAMPAMSPTMDKGGIVEWKVKEGESFSAGDVLLEVETDKAEIDVEAQDDGILAKILIGNGGKDIAVGKTIAYLAEPGDDIASLTFPAESEAPAEEAQPAKEAPAAKEEAQPPAASQQKTSHVESKSSGEVFNKADPQQTLLPSVQHLLEANGISAQQAFETIEASGPNGRLLKGDVLYHLGKISKDSAGAIAKYFQQHEHLQLSNIEARPFKEPVAETKEGSKEAQTAPEATPEPVKISKTFDLSKIEELQAKNAGKIKPFTVEEFVAEAIAKSEAYALQRHPVKSDYYDDLFEDIVSIPGDRFKIDYKLSYPETPTHTIPTIFDILTETAAETGSASTSSTVTVTLTLSEMADSEEKAALFVEKLSEYLN